jgi:DNA-binding SARP family transcriptional activator
LTKLLATCPGHALHREQIVEILWPDVDAESALNSFGKALHAARRAIEPELGPRKGSAYLQLSDGMVMLDAERVVIDADHFQRLAEDALRLRDSDAYERALGAYGGELLPEDRYEDWCAERRSFLAELRVRVLLGLVEALDQRGALYESADRLREVLRDDPTREDVHRRLIRLYAEMGTRDQAVRQFHVCEEVVRRELDLPPQRETVSLYHDVLANRIARRAVPRQRGFEPTGADSMPSPEAAALIPFVGREPVLEHLCQQLTSADQPEAGLILISGEAGVGKTRLLEELASAASQRGAAVLWGGGGAHAGDFAYGPFAVALEGYAATRSKSERNRLTDRYPALARFVPSLAADSAVAPLRADRRDLARAIVRLMTDLARKQPVLFVLGDLHEADRFSFDLVRYLAHLAVHRRWLMIGTVREDEVLAGTELRRMIDATIRERLSVKVDLTCLTRQDCDRLLRAALTRGRVGRELLDQIYTRSRGNPLFVVELLHEMQARGELVLASGCWHQKSGMVARTPTRVRALAAARLAPIDQTVRNVLAVVAVAATAEISIAELRAASARLRPPLSDAELSDALDHALHARLLEENHGGYAFRHPLLRSAIYESLSQHRRDYLHSALSHASADARPWCA